MHFLLDKNEFRFRYCYCTSLKLALSSDMRKADSAYPNMIWRMSKRVSSKKETDYNKTCPVYCFDVDTPNTKKNILQRIENLLPLD